MICLETQYFRNIKILLRIVGLWPYQQSRYVQFQFILFWGVLTAINIFQLTTFITSTCTSNFIIKILSSIIFFTFVWIIYMSFYGNMEVVKNLLIQLQNVCNELKEENEIAIIKKYGFYARRYTTALTTLVLCYISIIIIGQFWPNILDFLLPKNESHPRYVYVTMEYFLDQDKFYYLIQLHLSIAIFIGIMIILSIGTTVISYTQCICGLFRISSHRIEHAMANDNLQNINSKNKDLMLIGLIRAIDIHRQAMRLCDLLMYSFETLFFVSIVLTVACLSLNLLRISQITSSDNDIKEFILPITYTVICIKSMFLANYAGQDITDHSNDIYVTAYNFEWYRAPIHIQKVIFFLLQRSVKNFTINIGGLFDASFKCFATLIKASVSYFTVIYSTR